LYDVPVTAAALTGSHLMSQPYTPRGRDVWTTIVAAVTAAPLAIVQLAPNEPAWSTETMPGWE